MDDDPTRCTRCTLCEEPAEAKGPCSLLDSPDGASGSFMQLVGAEVPSAQTDASAPVAPGLLFVCSNNRCLSQMAEALAKAYFGSAVRVASAGTRVASSGDAAQVAVGVDPVAVQVMQQLGLPMQDVRQKSLADVLGAGGRFVLAVTLCSSADMECATVETDAVDAWVHESVDDPAASGSLDDYIRVRSELAAIVRHLAGQLGVSIQRDPLTSAVHASSAAALELDPFTESQAAAAEPSMSVRTNDSVAAEDAQKAEVASMGLPAGARSDEIGVARSPSAASSSSPPPVRNVLGVFETYLSAWVALCIVAGGAIGFWLPSVAEALQAAQVADTSIPIAVLLWLMIFPMLLQIDFASLMHVKRHPGPVLLTCCINFGIQPFLMYGISILFFTYVYPLERALADQYVAGSVLLGTAPCTAMVFVWSLLVKGNPGYTLVQVAVNDILVLVLYVPICVLLLGITSINLPYDVVAVSVAFFVLAPLLMASLTRQVLLRFRGPAALQAVIAAFKPVTTVGLLATLLLVFIFQGRTIGDKPLHIVMIMLPLCLQTLVVWMLTYAIGYGVCIPPEFLGPAALIATSNFFELAVAVAVAVYGADSGAALVTVVGVLVEVPLMLALVWLTNRLAPRLAARCRQCECKWLGPARKCFVQQPQQLPTVQ